MTEVSFFFNVADRTDYTCRLVRKSARRGQTVVLAGPPDVLARYDLALWTFDEIEFLPHRLLRAGELPPEGLPPLPVWLAEDAAAPGAHQVLVNLGDEVPVGFESFEKVVEVVSTEAADRAAARGRWKHYEHRGYPLSSHKVAG